MASLLFKDAANKSYWQNCIADIITLGPADRDPPRAEPDQ